MNTRLLPVLVLLATACVDRMPDDGIDTVADDEADSTDTTSDTDTSGIGDETSTADETTDGATDTSDGTTETEESDETGETDGPDCWTVNGFTWCTTDYNDLLVLTPCEVDPGVPIVTTWPYECALDQLIDATGWDNAWCAGSCWGQRGDVVMAILPECMIDFIGAVPASEWTSGCAAGEPLPLEGTAWEEWRCGDNTCAARIGALWTTPRSPCEADEWIACEP